MIDVFVVCFFLGPVFAHSIVLVSSSAKFKALLQQTSNLGTLFEVVFFSHFLSSIPHGIRFLKSCG